MLRLPRTQRVSSETEVTASEAKEAIARGAWTEKEDEEMVAELVRVRVRVKVRVRVVAKVRVRVTAAVRVRARAAAAATERRG